MNEQPERYDGRSVFLGVALALLVAFGLWLIVGAACFATLDMFARMGL